MKPADFARIDHKLNEQIRTAYKNTAHAMHKLFVIFRDGKPLELPVEAGTETENRLMDYDNGVGATFAFASTNRPYIEAMMRAIPELLDADDDMGLYIVEYQLT